MIDLQDTLKEAIESAKSPDYTHITLYFSCDMNTISVFYYHHLDNIIGSKTLEILNNSPHQLILCWERSTRQIIFLDLQGITKKIVHLYKEKYPYPINCYERNLQYEI